LRILNIIIIVVTITRLVGIVIEFDNLLYRSYYYIRAPRLHDSFWYRSRRKVGANPVNIKANGSTHSVLQLNEVPDYYFLIY